MAEFKQEILESRVTVGCATEEEARILLDWAHRQGYKWCNNDTYDTTITNWGSYKKHTVYTLSKGVYGNTHGTTHYTYDEALVIVEGTIPTVLEGRVLLIPIRNKAKVITIQPSTTIEYTATTITVDGNIIPFDGSLLQSIIAVLNNNTSPLQNFIKDK